MFQLSAHARAHCTGDSGGWWTVSPASATWNSSLVQLLRGYSRQPRMLQRVWTQESQTWSWSSNPPRNVSLTAQMATLLTVAQAGPASRPQRQVGRYICAELFIGFEARPVPSLLATARPKHDPPDQPGVLIEVNRWSHRRMPVIMGVIIVSQMPTSDRTTSCHAGQSHGWFV